MSSVMPTEQIKIHVENRQAFVVN